MAVFIVFLLHLLSFMSSSSMACDTCVYKAKASSFSSSSSSSSYDSDSSGSDSPLSAGSCGYGGAVTSFDAGFPAAAAPDLYLDGVGCGACFQVRCTHSELCNTKGVKVFIADMKNITGVKFVLSSPAFAGLGKDGGGAAAKLEKMRHAVDVEYKRVPCDYKKHNLSLRVDSETQNPKELNVTVFYQGGQTDILELELAPVGISEWKDLTHRGGGAGWSTDEAPAGPLQMRLVVTGGYDGAWVWANREVLPAARVSGEVYDSGVQIDQVKQELCYPCDIKEWK